MEREGTIMPARGITITKSDLDSEMKNLAFRLDTELRLDSFKPDRRRLYQVQDERGQPLMKYRLNKVEMYFALKFANEVLELSGRLND